MRPGAHLLAVLAASAAYSVFFTYYMVLKHESFMTYMLDLGLYIQNLWFLSSSGYPGFPWAAIHGSVLMYPLAALYSVYPRPVLLFAIQSTALAAAAVPLYKLAEARTRSRWFALLVSLLYLAYPPLHGVSSFDFHLEAFIPLLLTLMFYYREAGRPLAYLASTLALLSVFRFSPVVATAATAYLLARGNTRVLGRRGGLVRVRVSAPRAYEVAALVLSLAFLAYYSQSLLSFASASWSLVGLEAPRGPGVRTAAEYLVLVYGPLAFTPLLSTTQLVAAPWLLFVFTTTWAEVPRIYNQYPAFVTPVVFIGFVEVAGRVRARGSMALLAVLSTVTLLAYSDPVFTNPYPPVTPRWPSPTEKDLVVDRLLSSIPEGVVVLTQNNLAPHLAYGRRVLIKYDGRGPEPDYIVVDKSHFSFNEPNLRPPPAEALPKLLSRGGYGLRVKCGPVEVYERGYSGGPVVVGGCGGEG